MLGTLRQRLEGLLTAPGEELGRWGRFLRYQIHLWRFCGRRLREHNAAAMSSALSFRTIFALVPALALAILVMKSVGLVEHGKRSLREFLTRSGFEQIALVRPARTATAPASAPATRPKTINVAESIEKFVTQAERKLTFGAIGPAGVVLLIWTALTLLTTMEGSLNRIFGAPRSRAMTRRVPLYWSVVTLGPVMLAATVYLGGVAAAACRHLAGVSWILAALNWAGPPVVGIILLAALYKLLPNTHVRYRSALGGAVVAVPLWMVAKWAFALYVTAVVGKGSLYGALGLLPLFLLWLNLCWMIFLFGAELASTAANLERMWSAELADSVTLGPSDLLAAALAVARPYARGAGPVAFPEIVAAVNLPPQSVRRLLDRLSSAGILAEVGSDRAGGYTLARPAEIIRVADVMEMAGSAQTPGARYDGGIAQAVAAVGERARDALGELTLAELAAPQAEN